jgi:Fe2+ transport system protein FeoA
LSLNNTKDAALMPPDTLLPLELLEPGEWADIAEICSEPAWVHRLAELGLRAGTRVLVLQAGSPCLLQIGGLRLSLRSDPATRILVQPLGVAEPAA